MADVRLNGDKVIVEGTDVCIEHPERRSGAGGAERRALVHDFDDALALNYVGDYPSGVRIFGPASIERGPLSVERLRIQEGLVVSAESVAPPSTTTPSLAVPGTPASVESLTDALTTRLRNGLFGEGVPSRPASEVTLNVDRLVRQLFELQREVAELTARVQVLESR
jgi:hypothetical protein